MLKSTMWPLDTVTLLKKDLWQKKYTLKSLVGFVPARVAGACKSRCRAEFTLTVGLADSGKAYTAN